MDNKKVEEKTSVEGSKKSNTIMIVCLGVVIIIAIVIIFVVVGGNKKYSQNNDNDKNTTNEQAVMENEDNSNVENNDTLNQDDEIIQEDENISAQDVQNSQIIEEIQDQTMSFSEIRVLEENSDDFNSNLVIKAHQLAQEKYKDKTLSLIYTNSEDSKVTVNGKQCYQITITEESEDSEKENDILGYMAISLEDEKVYFRDVNGTY